MNRIKEYRTKAGMMQGELAKLAGISQPYLHDLEHGNRGAKPETLQRIASALRVSVQDLQMTNQRVG